MKMIKSYEEQKADLSKMIEALEGIIDQNEQKKTFTVQGLVEKLIVAFCDETTATWQYFTASHVVRGQGRVDCLDEYNQHMTEQAQHLQKIAHRIEELGGRVVTNLNEISSVGHTWQIISTSDPKQQLNILIDAERDARIFYQDIINYAKGLKDYVTERLFKQILEDETKHEFDLKRLLEQR